MHPLLVTLVLGGPMIAQLTTYQPVRPVAPNITLGFNVYTPWRTEPHNGIDYVSPLGDTLMSIGGGGIIGPLGYTKPDASGFGSINPDGAGPAIWMKYTLATGEPIYVLYGHTATSWDDATTGAGSAMFNFACTYKLRWRNGDAIGTNTVVGKTAPFYLNTNPAPHLHVGVFKPNKSCNKAYCPPPLSGWGYSQIHLTTGDYINPEEFFTSSQYLLSVPQSLTIVSLTTANTFGGYYVAQSPPCASPPPGDAVVFSFTLSRAFIGVAISAPAYSSTFCGTTTGTVYLTNALGPSATAANVVATRDASTLPLDTFTLSPANQQIFTGLNLVAGTYYVTFVGTSGSVDVWFANSPVIFSSGDGSVGNDFIAFPRNGPFPPASSFSTINPPNMVFSVSGTPQ